MGFFDNIGAGRPRSRQIAQLIGALTAEFRFASDLDLYTNAVNNISQHEDWVIKNQVIFNHPIYVKTPAGLFEIRLFNELRHCGRTPATLGLLKQYDDEIMLFLQEADAEFAAGAIDGYFAAIVTESSNTERTGYFPKESDFEYYWRAEILPFHKGRAFRIKGKVNE